MQIHELNSRAPTDTDEMALDTGSQTYKTRVGLLKPQFTSYDMANPTSWDDVPLITGNSSIIFVFERLTRAVKNLRYLWKLLGSNDFSNVAETISGAIGNTALTTTATDISGAIAEHEADISTLEEDISTLNGNLSTTISGDAEGVIAGSWTLRKRGNIVFLQVVNVSLLPSGSTSLGTIIPSQYRPISEASFTIIRRFATFMPIAVTIGTTGELRLYNYGSALSTTTPINQLLSWPTA